MFIIQNMSIKNYAENQAWSKFTLCFIQNKQNQQNAKNLLYLLLIMYSIFSSYFFPFGLIFLG